MKQELLPTLVDKVGRIVLEINILKLRAMRDWLLIVVLVFCDDSIVGLGPKNTCVWMVI